MIFPIIILTIGVALWLAFLFSKASRRKAPPDPVDPPKPLPKATVHKIGPVRFSGHEAGCSCEACRAQRLGEVPHDFCETCGTAPCEEVPLRVRAPHVIEENP